MFFYQKFIYRLKGILILIGYTVLPFQRHFIVGWPNNLQWVYWLTSIWLTFGLIVLTSASIYVGNFSFVQKQLFWVLVGLINFGIFLQAPLNWIQIIANLGFFLNLIGIILTIPYGVTINGASRWLCFGPILLQPSELIKPFFIWHTSYLVSYWSILKISTKVFWILLNIIIFSAILLQPNLSTASLFGSLLWLILLMSNLSKKTLLYITATGFLASSASIFWNKYQQVRLSTFLYPWGQIQNDGYQLVQSLLAIGSGGLFGKGLGNSTQKLGYLPIEYTDFIFAVFSEEYGLIGNIIFLLSFYFWTKMTWSFANQIPSNFFRLIAYSTIAAIIQQSFCHIGVSIGFLPTTGLPLPLWSYGGNAILSSSINLGLFFRTVEVFGEQESG